MPAEEGFEVITKRDDHLGKYKKLVFDQDRLVGASMINTVVDPGVLLCLIEKGIDVGKEKSLLFEQPGIISQRIMLGNEKKC
jgi:NAD(P)H-nitrite reductase large subunit